MLTDLDRSLAISTQVVEAVKAVARGANDSELARLSQFCARLISTISMRQNYFPWDIEQFCASPSEEGWRYLQITISDLATEVTRIFKLLKREEGDFVIDGQDTYRSLVFGLADRQRIFEEVSRMSYPPTEEDLARLRSIAASYDKLRNELRQSQKEIAEYVQSKREAARRDESPIGQGLVVNAFLPGSTGRWRGGDDYRGSNINAGIVGSGSRAENTSFNLSQTSNSGSSAEALSSELRRLLEAMKAEAASAEQEIASESVEKAAGAAEKGKENHMLAHLKNAGTWALGIAEKIGVPLATGALKGALGLP